MTTDPLKDDFRNFLYVTWKHLRLPDPTPVQYDIAAYLQHGPKRSIIQAFRGVGKSWITSAYVCWLLYRDPQLEILVVSASKLRADEFTTFTMQLIKEMEILAFLRPRPGQRDSRIAFDVGPKGPSHSPSVKSIGISGQIAGSRADVIIPDDIEVPNNSATQMLRDKLAEAVKEFDAVIKPIEGSSIKYLGTPQTMESLYSELQNRGYEARIWPAEIPEEKQALGYGTRLAPVIQDMISSGRGVGEPTDPARFGEIDLAERKASYGRSGYALQFMLDTTLSDSDRFPLKQDDLMVMSLDYDRGPLNPVWASSPELVHKDLPNLGFSGDNLHSPMDYGGGQDGSRTAEYQGAAMYIDPSGRGKDETGYAVVKMLHGVLYCTEAGGFVGGYAVETLEKLATVAQRNACNLIRIEDNFGDGMFNELFKPVCRTVGYNGIVEGHRSVGQKEARVIDTLEPVMNRHKLIISKSVVEKDYQTMKLLQATHGDSALTYSMMYQLTHITKERGALRHDDRLEALAGAVAYWVENMAQDTQEALHYHNEEARMAHIEKFMAGARDYSPGSDGGERARSGHSLPGVRGLRR
jgi:hypothetical protein